MTENLILAPLVLLVGAQFTLYVLGWLLCGLLIADERPAAWCWAAFMLLLAVGMVLAAQRNETRGWWAYVGSAISWLLSYAMLNRGLELFLRLPGWDRVQVAIVAVTTAALVCIGPSEAMASWRVLFSYGGLALFMLVSVLRAWPAFKVEFGWKLAAGSWHLCWRSPGC